MQKPADTPAISLAYQPATKKQRHIVLCAAVLMLAAFGLVARFADAPLPPIGSFIATVDGIIFVNDLITSFLLFAHYSVARSRAILVLATGYLFTALIVIPHALTFPGAFTPNGLFGAGLQNTAWLYFFWHMGIPIFLFSYACLKDFDRFEDDRSAVASTIATWSAAVVCIVVGLTLLALSGDRLLPIIFVNSTHFIASRVRVLVLANIAIAIAPLVLLWIRRRSVLDYWLMLVIVALIFEQTTVLFITARFALGFYTGRLFSLTTSMLVLGLLLAETTRLYARLAHTNAALAREKDHKLMNLEAATASIAHEMAQPLSSIAFNGDAALEYLDKTPANLTDARLAINDMIESSHRTSEAINGIRALFHKGGQTQQLVDLNEVVLEALNSLRSELSVRHILTKHNLSDIPLVHGNRGQLQQLVFNLIHNAVEAMSTTTDRSCVLDLATQTDGTDAIVVAIKDSGPGIDPSRLDGIFDAFVTTKSQGTGLGLAICRLIVERHGGRLSAWSDGKNGALFQFLLPIRVDDEAATRA